MFKYKCHGMVIIVKRGIKCIVHFVVLFLCLAIITISIDNFISSSNTTPSSKTSTITSNTSIVTLPTNYGRSPITQVEINMINVSPKSITYSWYFHLKLTCSNVETT